MYYVAETSGTETSCPMTWEEENALRYVAGYICRKVQSKLQKSSAKNKEEMVLFCMELCGDEDGDRGTEEWTNAIDRGGLWHINDYTYTVFSILEEEIRKHLKVSALKDLNETTKKKILEAVLKNDELLFEWTLITTDADDSVGMEVLQRICELYLTVRGFALEMYKQRSKKQVQKSKALRKKVATGKEDSTE